MKHHSVSYNGFALMGLHFAHLLDHRAQDLISVNLISLLSSPKLWFKMSICVSACSCMYWQVRGINSTEVQYEVEHLLEIEHGLCAHRPWKLSRVCGLLNFVQTAQCSYL